MSASRGAATREIIQDWADGDGGYTFERGRMEAAIRELCFEQRVSLSNTADDGSKKGKVTDAGGAPVKLNKQDVDFVVKELAVPRKTAEQALSQHKGDMTKALIELMTPSA